ncbi:hypothetical protein HanRHA438_Chr17g0830761 [Helianthus annuus]|nr:hypothetical protein HanHA89_Chr17g0721221 [Helianthus annuus]KAJ0827865.1 hypothetical protein HanRHA438_Chr17g0830761 [Helianthus annuus]
MLQSALFMRDSIFFLSILWFFFLFHYMDEQMNSQTYINKIVESAVCYSKFHENMWILRRGNWNTWKWNR